MAAFSHLPKSEFERYSKILFGILAGNMSEIAPTGNPMEDDFKSWHHAASEGLKKGSRQIILISDPDTGSLIGYFQYSADGDTFVMEEIQLLKAHQGKQIVRQLFLYVLPRLSGGLRFAEAYASKRNPKSNGILARLGLSIVGENKSGHSWHYKGAYEDLLNWLNGRN